MWLTAGLKKGTINTYGSGLIDTHRYLEQLVGERYAGCGSGASPAAASLDSDD
jgi:hypothetical protein